MFRKGLSKQVSETVFPAAEFVTDLLKATAAHMCCGYSLLFLVAFKVHHVTLLLFLKCCFYRE